MALSAPAIRNYRLPHLINPQVKNAAVVYPGGYTALGSQDHATANVPGRAFPWTGAAGEIPGGLCNMQTPAIGSSVLGTTGDTAASPIVRVGLDGSACIVDLCPVTGLAGTIADVNLLVYATADGTFDVAVPALPNRTPIGMVSDFFSSTVCSVHFFSREALAIMALCGGGQTTWFLGCVGAETPSAQNLLTGIVAPDHGKIPAGSGAFFSICINASTDADWTQLVNLEIGGTNVTGGVITQATADAQGDKQSGTSVTALGIFHAGDLIDVEAATVTAGTANNGLYGLYLTYIRQPGL